MKLNIIHLFLLLLGILVFSNFNNSVKEGMKNKKNKKSHESSKHHSPVSNHAAHTLPYHENDFVKKEDIPHGDEHLYILKSKIVPPVCPKCPDVSVCPKSSSKKCPPCPPCGRCPVAPFECKKVPTYTSGDQDYMPNFVDGALTNNMPSMMGSTTSSGLPMPMLNDFSQFS